MGDFVSMRDTADDKKVLIFLWEVQSTQDVADKERLLTNRGKRSIDGSKKVAPMWQLRLPNLPAIGDS